MKDYKINFKSISIILILFFPLLTPASQHPEAVCLRPVEYKLIKYFNEVSDDNEEDDYQSIINLGKNGSSIRLSPQFKIANILARDVLIHSAHEQSYFICDKPKRNDLADFIKSVNKKGLHIRVLDVKAMLEMTLEFDFDYLIKNKYYADFKDAFALILLFLSKERDAHFIYLGSEKFYAKKYLDFIKETSDFREIFLEYLNPNIIVWNRFEKINNTTNVNKEMKNHDDRYSDFMFAFLRQIQTFDPGNIVQSNTVEFPHLLGSSLNFNKNEKDAQGLIFVNPKLYDFARLKKYQNAHKLTNSVLRARIIRVAKKDGTIFFSEIVDKLVLE